AAFLAVEIDADAFAFQPMWITTLAIPGNEFVAEIERSHVTIRRLPIILEVVASAAAGNPARVIDAETPARQVEEVNAIVPDFAGAPVPKPVPVVVQNIVAIRFLRGGALPQRIVQPSRRRRRLASTDRRSMVGIPGAREKNFPYLAGFHGFNSFDHPWPASALVAHLHLAI